MTDQALELGEYVDKLVSMDVRAVGVISTLYNAVRNHTSMPLTFAAAKALIEKVGSRETVIIATGFPLRGWIAPDVGETDGPAGAAVLARAMNLGLRSVPMIISEEGSTEIVRAACRALGLIVVSREEAEKARHAKVSMPCVVVEDFPTKVEEADVSANKILEELSPKAIVSIERPDRNEKGKYHTVRPDGGIDITPWTAKVDRLFEKARLRKILTIGIGDAGSDLGLGNIKELVKSSTKFGSDCGCPCHSGIHAATQTDHSIASTVSDWGAYGVVACLAYLLKNPAILHTPKLEKRVTIACAMSGAFNPGAATPENPYGKDDLPIAVHKSVVEILETMTARYISRMKNASA